MDFRIKLNLLFDQLNFTNIKVARYGGLDASLISRFRNGKRIPSLGSKQIQLLARGIVLLAEEQEKIEELCNICNFSVYETQQLFLKLDEWLSKDSGLKAKQSTKKPNIAAIKTDGGFVAFSKKMDILMSSFKITNINLAKALHIDASLISRLRTGTRSPTPGSWFPQQFCYWMAERIFIFPPEIREDKLFSLIGRPIPNTVELLSERLLEWMYTEFEFQGLRMYGDFLYRLENLRKSFAIPTELVTSIKAVPVYGKSSENFIGIDGLKNAIIHFLVFTAMQSEPCILYLYSDQPLEWMTEDPGFANAWSLLMFMILHNKNQIHIIHNINRSISDIFKAFEKWIPLYMTGLIRSFVCEENLKGHFYQTMFIMPRVCSISATFVAGTEDSAKYLFTTSQPLIEYNYQQFQALMKYSKPLHKTYTFESLGDYIDFIKTTPFPIETSNNLMYTPSIATMPDDLFEKVIERSNLDDKNTAHAKEYRKNSIETFNLCLSKTGVTEFIIMPSKEDIFAENVKFDLPALDLCYTVEEFIQHIQNIIQLIGNNDNYQFYPLFESPLKNMIISLYNEEQSFVTRIEKPITVFLFENKLMNQSFSRYLNNLAQKIMPDIYRKEDIQAQLVEYINQIK